MRIPALKVELRKIPVSLLLRSLSDRAAGENVGNPADVQNRQILQFFCTSAKDLSEFMDFGENWLCSRMFTLPQRARGGSWDLQIGHARVQY